MGSESPHATATPARSERYTVLAVLAGGAALRLLAAPFVPLTPDEAYYVDWARHLQPGYLDHPPLVAWLLALPVRLAGHSELAVRLPAVLMQIGTGWLAASLCSSRAGPAAGVAVVVLLQAAPIFSLGAALMTPDAPLALGWVGALWAFDRAVRSDGRWFLAAGAFVGWALLSKLTGALLGVALLAALTSTADGRRALGRSWPWLGALLAMVIASPMLAWNAAHGWPSLAFQARHALSGSDFSLLRLAGSLGAQMAYVSPVLIALAAAAAWRALLGSADAVSRALALSALPVAAFFTLAAAFTPGSLPHWPAPAWLSATLLVAIEGTRWLRVAVVSSAALAALATALLALAPLSRDPLDEMRGWREGARAARVAAGGARIAATHWIALGQLGWYTGTPAAYVGDRVCAASYYEGDPRRAGESLLVVVDEGLGPSVAELEARMGPLRPAGFAEARHGGRVVRRFRFYRWEPASSAGP